MNAKSIPEMIGFPPVPWDRTRSCSAASYRAMYALTEGEAEDILARHGREAHKAIDRELSLRYAQDPAYRARVNAAAREGDITETEPGDEVKAVMERLIRNMKRGKKIAGQSPPAPGGRRSKRGWSETVDEREEGTR